uniref:Beta-lactamase domain-containing protein n=1 Tax=Caenorhabditis japonica TaxID=281687 RepID=A0A8R1HZM5_CAEJA
MRSLFFLKLVAIPILFSIGYRFISDRLYSNHKTEIGGVVDTRFEKVREVFRRNFENGWEIEGSALTVYVDGHKVVDLWGGYADKQAARKWAEDTITVTFSTTKAAAALAVALLYEQGKLHYDDLVSKYWPGFGTHGRDNVTIQMALSHMAGMAWLDTPITEEIAADHVKMRQTLEREKPKWAPGTKSGYHAYTYGWIVDQIVRHTDDKKRGIGQFFREEIASKLSVDYHIGLPKSEQHRVARISTPRWLDRADEVLTDFRVFKYLKSLYKLVIDHPLKHIVRNPSWLEAVSRCTVNNPDYHRLEQAGALGMGNARSLASLFDQVIRGKLLNQATLKTISRPFINESDFIFEDTVAKGYGFFHLPINRAGVEYGLGHSGHGCQMIITDFKNRVTIAYVTNGLKTGLYDLCRTYSGLQSSVYDVIEQLNE